MISKYRSSRIRDVLGEQGAACAGFADISGLALPIARKYPFGICFAIRHSDEAVNQLPEDELWNSTVPLLTEKAGRIYQAIQELLESWGYHFSRVPTNTRVDQLPDPGEELPQKTLATLSGLGWIGKSTLLISPTYGPRTRLGALVTDMPLETDAPVVESRCGNCRACVDICPVHAITGNAWTQATPRSRLIDVRRCYDHLWSTKDVTGRRQVCGLCLKVCPVGQKAHTPDASDKLMNGWLT